MIARMLEDLVRDVGYGLRTLRRNPGFTITAILSLALGIGANAGIFSLFDQVALRSLAGVRDPAPFVILDWNGRDLATVLRHGPPDVLSALPRPAGATTVLRRCVLPSSRSA